MITAEQRKDRRKSIGSSDVPPIMGLDEFRTATDVYWSKVLAMPDIDNKSFQVGRMMELSISSWGADKIGLPFTPDVFVRCKDPRYPYSWAAANLDGLINDRPWGIEAKYSTAAKEWGESEGTDAVPPRVLVQAQYQCAVAELERVYVPVMLIGYSAQFKMYQVDRNDELIDLIMARGAEFWNNHVIPQIPPDGITVPPMDYLKKMERDVDWRINLGEDAAALVEQYLAAGTALKAAQAEEERVKRLLIGTLGQAECGLLPGGKLELTYFEQNSSPAVDLVRLRALDPELAKNVITQGKHRRMGLRKPKRK